MEEMIEKLMGIGQNLKEPKYKHGHIFSSTPV